MTGHECALVKAFAAARARHGDRVAVTDTTTELTYAELDAASDELAAALGAVLDDAVRLVAVSTRRDVTLVVAILAVLKSGRGYVPIDPEYPHARQDFLRRDSAVTVSIVESDRPGAIPVPVADGAVFVTAHDTTVRHAVPDDVAYVIYTSGSTGEPKGCVVGAREVASLLAATDEVMSLSSSDTWTMFHSYSFDFSVWELWGALTHGARLVVVPRAALIDPVAWARLLCQEEVTVLSQVPSVFTNLVDACVEESVSLRHLRYVVLGGEAVTERQLTSWLTADVVGGAKVVNMYGITETTVHTTHHELSGADIPFAGGSPIGRPLPHLTVSLRDERGDVVPAGAPGEIWVAGAGVSHGYLGRPDLTTRRFLVDDSIGAPNRYYRSGDWAVANVQGELFYQGRRDDQVKIRGHRVELGEIDAVVSTAAGVRDCACAVTDDSGMPTVMAYVVPVDPAVPLDIRTIRRHVNGLLPRHLRPNDYVPIGALPLTSNGKLDRRALAAAPRCKEATDMTGVDRAALHRA